MPVSEKTFRQLALEDIEGKWELHRGRLYSKAGVMTAEHDDISMMLGVRLANALPRDQFRVRVFSGHIRRTEANYYIADVLVIPAAVERRQRGTGKLESYDEPLPLIVEVWSRSTGQVDFKDKLPTYQQRRDQEIWLIHPYERMLTAWRRQSDDSYTETIYRGGTISPVALPGVRIDLDAFWEEQDA